MNAKEQEEIALKMLRLHEDNIWVIGYMESLPVLIAKDKNIRNFLKTQYSVTSSEISV